MHAVWCAAAISAGIAFFLIKSRINYLRLPEIPISLGELPSDLTVVIPARNEEKNIGGAVSSFGGMPVLVVDDDSRDATVACARKAGAFVISAPPLMKGLLGKPNACLAGARVCVSDWILFVDADTRYDPRFLPSLMSYVRSEQLAVASVFLRQERVTVFESMLLPYSFALYFCGVDGRAVNNPKSMEALANGQCLLFRRDAYEFINGHRAVAHSVIEDVALAQVVKRHRVASRVLRAEQLGSVRMYDSFGAIWRGFQKNSFRFLLVNPGSGVQVIAASILLTSYLPVLVWLISENQLAYAAGFALLPTLLLMPWYRSIGVLWAPVAIYVFQLIALNGMVTTLFGRKAIWKGRRV